MTDKVSCQNCEWTGAETDCAPLVDILESVAPGEIMPAGECPECGAVAHLTGPDASGAEWVSWAEHGGPDSDCHWFSAEIAGALYHVTPPARIGGAKWRAWKLVSANGWARIGTDYGDDERSQLSAMRACARSAGIGDGIGHGVTRSRESLCSEAGRLVRAAGEPDCTFAAMSDHELGALIAELKRNAA